MYYTYILKSKTLDSYYTGHTNDLKRRLKDHNSGSSKYSQKASDWRLVWYSVFLKKEKAIDFERYLKSSSGHAFRNKRFL